MQHNFSRLIFAVLFLSATPAAQKALSHEFAFEGWAEDLAPSFADSSLHSFAEGVEHDILALRIEYETLHRGEMVKASGLLVYPLDLEGPAPIVVWTHGTLFDQQGAPSNYRHAKRMQLLPSLHGMITLLPDYTGYGVSKERIHPYIMRKDLVRSVIDMIHAGRDVLAEEEVPFQDEVMLWGFSEGGYVALAVAHELESHPTEEFSLAETHAVSGPYSMIEAASVILADDTYPIPAYIALLFAAYNERYWQRPLTDFFVEPYAGVVTRFQAREIGLGELAGSMPQALNALMAPDFRRRFRAGEELSVRASFAENDIPAWSPETPVILYHGTKDRDVPIAIAQRQFAAMMDGGARPDRLQLLTYDGLDHSQTATRALGAFLNRLR